jgi:hypothetical protein
MWLDNTKVRKWKDVVNAFIRQYKFNIDMASNRLSFQAMKKNNKEFVRECAQN